MASNPVLTTERCTLRRLSSDDHAHIWTATRTPGFTDGMSWDPPESEAEMQTFTDSALKDWETGEKYVWTIERKDNQGFIGRIELKRDREQSGNTWGLGYFIHPDEQKKGYATEASIEVVRFAFEGLKADTILSSHADWNMASGNVLKKIGMKHTGHTVGRVVKKGVPVKSEEYTLTREEWEQQRRI